MMDLADCLTCQIEDAEEIKLMRIVIGYSSHSLCHHIVTQPEVPELLPSEAQPAYYI